MQIERHVAVACEPDRAFALVNDLCEYPTWMDLVHAVDEVASNDQRRTWDVELQAQVGPFARSKRLRMVRTVHDPPHRVVFERAEIDGRRHSPWILAATLGPAPTAANRDPSDTVITMTLEYGGNLWTGAVLQRVLDDHVERGANALSALLADTGDEGPIS